MNYEAFIDELEKIATSAAVLKPALTTIQARMGNVAKRMAQMKKTLKPPAPTAG